MSDDPQLIKRTLDGDRAAFDDIVRRYQDGLFRHLLRLTGRPEDAEDLCQEAFIRFYGARRRFLATGDRRLTQHFPPPKCPPRCRG